MFLFLCVTCKFDKDRLYFFCCVTSEDRKAESDFQVGGSNLLSDIAHINKHIVQIYWYPECVYVRLHATDGVRQTWEYGGRATVISVRTKMCPLASSYNRKRKKTNAERRKRVVLGESPRVYCPAFGGKSTLSLIYIFFCQLITCRTFVVDFFSILTVSDDKSRVK